jgi:hypothetical protein
MYEVTAADEPSLFLHVDILISTPPPFPTIPPFRIYNDGQTVGSISYNL